MRDLREFLDELDAKLERDLTRWQRFKLWLFRLSIRRKLRRHSKIPAQQRVSREALDIGCFITPEMAERANNARLADLRRRCAKFRRLSPHASPQTNLYSPWLDYVEGDPERIEDFMDP